MKLKKILKIVAWIIGAILLLFLCLYAYAYYKLEDVYKVDSDKFPHYVGYINPKNAEFTDGFSLCDSTYLYGSYSSAAPKIYKGTKHAFRKMINENYENLNYQDNGFLNLRFHINCNGEVGNVEINELDTEYENTNLNDSLVDQLVNLSVNKENWTSIIQNDKRQDVYMYLIYKIKNGDVVEILP